VSSTDKPHCYALLMRGRSSVDSILSNLNSMMEEVSEIRNRLKRQQDSADKGLRDSAWLTMVVPPVVLLNTLRRGLQETTSSHVRELQLA
jgi:hypothetical protein